MKRQQLRKAILIISFLLLPITLFYFSPAIIVFAAKQGIINGSFIIFCLLTILAVFFGRFMCGWIMPCGGIQEICFSVNNRQFKKTKLNYLKYFVWGILVITIAISAYKAGGYHKIDFLYQTENGVSISRPQFFIIYYIVISLFLIVSFTLGKRGLCHSFCWMAVFMIIGKKISSFAKLPALKLSLDNYKCSGCGICSKKCPMSLNVVNSIKNGKTCNTECILCGACVDACKNKAITFYFGRNK